MWDISVGFGYLLGVTIEFGMIDIWIAAILDETLRGVIMLFRWRFRIWQNKRVAT